MSLRLLIVAFAFVVAVSGLSGTASAQREPPNTDRPGNDIRNTVVGNADACLQLCNRERECRAWTFVKAGAGVVS